MIQMPVDRSNMQHQRLGNRLDKMGENGKFKNELDLRYVGWANCWTLLRKSSGEPFEHVGTHGTTCENLVDGFVIGAIMPLDIMLIPCSLFEAGRQPFGS